MKKNPIAFIALAVIFVAMALIRLPEGMRAVDIVSLLGAGVAAGALIAVAVQTYRLQN